jgi:hypothetical protein
MSGIKVPNLVGYYGFIWKSHVLYHSTMASLTLIILISCCNFQRKKISWRKIKNLLECSEILYFFWNGMFFFFFLNSKLKCWTCHGTMVVGIYICMFFTIWYNLTTMYYVMVKPLPCVLCRPQGKPPGEPGNLGILPYIMRNCKTIILWH